ncbi:uncharacterized protein LOC130644520 isoform X2 [Hydractinia symbiolongicarpus]|uniref:uncharacterized protein LOC130644520 isoform X2 n=1 Tax=Hydractinia symbiolongicarpus TaxID=13093 RepID=UPI002549F89D|nr:uncharacterized protein LOC130644520 isoform X2 [Hydractinia symbiolongicarpus]
MLLALLLLTGSVTTIDVVEERHVSIDIKDNNSLKDYKKPFEVLVVLRNTYKSDLDDVSLHFIHSKRVKINKITTDGQDKSVTSAILLTNKLGVNGTITFKLNVILEDESSSESQSGYHVDNILIDIHWLYGGVLYATGYEAILLPFVIPGCDTVFDVKNNVLRSDQVSATSYYVSSSPQEFGPKGNGWCADQKKNVYFEILFTKRVRLTSIRTAERTAKDHWMKEFKIAYKKDGEWLNYTQNGYIKLFKAYKEMGGNKFPWFLHPLECDGIRVIPTHWEGELICARMEIKGCYISQEDMCIDSIGMEDGRIPNASLSARFQGANSSIPEHGRLNALSTGWKGNPGKSDWLQIDLGSLFKITRIGIQGGYKKKFYVTEFKFWFSNDSFVWNSIRKRTDGVKTIFTNSTEDHVSLVSLEPPVFGRSFRIEPSTYEIIALKAELYGCLVKERTTEEIIGKVKEFPTRTVLVDEKNGNIFVCHRNIPRANCYQSDQLSAFQRWKSCPNFISNVLAVDSSGSSYARTTQGSYMIKKNDSDIWMDISQNTLTNRAKVDVLYKAFEIPTIIPNVESKIRWTLKDNRQIAGMLFKSIAFKSAFYGVEYSVRFHYEIKIVSPLFDKVARPVLFLL